jgi:hypothetical protein
MRLQSANTVLSQQPIPKKQKNLNRSTISRSHRYKEPSLKSDKELKETAKDLKDGKLLAT